MDVTVARTPAGWRDMEGSSLAPLMIGPVDSELPPDLFVSVWDHGRLAMRVHLYSGRQWSPFADAQLWRDYLVIGFGYEVHLITLRSGKILSIQLGEHFDYFSQIAPAAEYLVVASGTRVWRIEPNGAVRWVSEAVGLDGVVLHTVEPPVISGRGEWDPPGGWQPFRLDSDTGVLL